MKDLLALNVTVLVVLCFTIVIVARSTSYGSLMNDMNIFIYLLGTEHGNCV